MNVNGGLRATIGIYLHGFWGSTKLCWSGFSLLKQLGTSLDFKYVMKPLIGFRELLNQTRHFVYQAKCCMLVLQ